MGYILPITPLQYADYANRLAMKDTRFTYIDGVQAIEAQHRFQAEVLRQQERLLMMEQQRAQRQHRPVPTIASTEEVVMYRPKPMSTAEIVGKGFVINAYA